MITGALGVFGYTGDGIAKSLDRAIHQKTMKHVLAAKGAEAACLIQVKHIVVADAEILKAFLQRRAS